ncbi:MAG: glycine--tRNA ligase subunit beta, partial [Acidobacteria bacterium]|nr:glycine--tRNA ligase subunit beta [Acidobacteriota bacterium]
MSETRTFLLELHCEEIPARFLKPLSHDFGAAIWTWGDEVGVAIEDDGAANDCTTYTCDFYSPRKLAWRISRLLTNQPDQTEIQIGPPQRMCVDEDGKPTIQGLKFAEKWGVDFSAVRFEQPAGKKE